MQVQQQKLKNNLETLFIDSPGSTSGSVQIWFRAGSALEPSKDFGIAHFLEHMFFKGTPTRPGAGIAHEVESFGGEINAFTSFDYTCYYINTPNSYLKNTIDILMDMVSHPQFKQEDLVPERGVVFEEYRRSQDDPNQYSFHQIQKGSFSGGYAHPILGNEKTIKGFTRKQLIDFRKKYYNLSNAMLVVSGDLKKKDSLIKTIEKYKLPSGQASKFPKFSLKKKSTLSIHQKDVNLAQLTFTIQAPKYDDGHAASEDLAFNCLGHGETSKLYQNLVLSGNLASACSCSTMFMSDGGLHFIRVNFPFDKLSQVTKKLSETFNEAYKEGIPSFDVQKIKNQYIASKVYEKESLESFAFSMGHGFAQSGDIYSDDKFIQKIKKSSSREVNESLRNVFHRPFHMSMQIPIGASKSKAKTELEKLQKKLVKLQENKNKLPVNKSGLLSSYDPQVQLINIKKGVQLLYRQNLMAPTFVLHAYMKGGLTEESEKNNGYHHLLSGLLSKGYGDISYKELKSDLENKSASLGGFTGKNAYGMTMHGQTEHSSQLFAHFFGSLLTPQAPDDFLEHEKEMAVRALANQEKDPLRQCFRSVNQIMFANHPYSQNVLGTEENIKSVKKLDLINLHKKNIKEKEILLTYCGDLEINELQELLAPYMTSIEPRSKSKQARKPLKPLLGQKRHLTFDREQTQIFYGIPTQKMGSQEALYLKVLTTHLSGQSSDLFVEVRDRQGLCYSAQPVHFSALEGGYWGIYMASGHDKVDAAIPAIQKIIENLRINGLSKKEFGRIKKMIEGQALLNIQTNEDYANIYSVPVLQGHGIDFYHQNNELIKKMTHQELQKNLKKILSKKWSTFTVGRK